MLHSYFSSSAQDWSQVQLEVRHILRSELAKNHVAPDSPCLLADRRLFRHPLSLTCGRPDLAVEAKVRIHITGGLKTRSHNDPVKALGIVHPILRDASRHAQRYHI